MADEIHKDDEDTKIIVVIKETDTDGVVSSVDVSTASTKQIIFEKPDNTFLTKTAEFDTDGTDGRIYYKTINGDLDMIGSWKKQGYVVIGVGKWKSNVDDFEVYENLE